MFSGAKHKLQKWRQKKSPTKIMAYATKENFLKKLDRATEHLKNLQIEGTAVVDQLNDQVLLLGKIHEDPSAVEDKISLLKHHVKSIEYGLQESEAISSFFATVEAVNALVDKNNREILDLQHQASTLVKENKKLRTELQIFQDHHERSELKAVELEVQVEHLKFMSTLPAESIPLFGTDDKTEEKEEEEKFAINLKVAIPFLEDDEFLENAGTYILSVLDNLDFTANSRLKILFDLIKSYIHDGAYDIAIPLLKTTVEDLATKHSPHEKIIFTMMEVMGIVYNMTQRFKDALDVQTEILQIRKDWMSEDQIGLAQTLSNLAVLHTKIGKVKAARVFCREALDLKYKVYGDDDVETAKELHNMGVLYSYDNKFCKAIDCMLTAFNIIRSSPKRSVFCLATIASNVATVHILNDELYEAKCAFNSTLKFLHRELDKMLAGKNLTIRDVLDDKNKIDGIPDCENKKEVKRIVNLIDEVEEKSKTVSHVIPKDTVDVEEKYSKLTISTSDEENGT